MKPLIVFCLALLFCGVSSPQTKEDSSKPVVLSAQMKNATVLYKLNGKIVEDSVQNSLLTNLTRILVTRGSGTAVFIIVDVRAPFSEFGKLETALDKVGLPHRRFFVTNFTDGIMNEIHWDETGIPIPQP